MLSLISATRGLAAAASPCLRVVSCGGSAVHLGAVCRALATLETEVFQSYGMSETCGKLATSVAPSPGRLSNDLHRVGGVGTCFELVRLRILPMASTVTDCQATQTGVLWCKGTTVMRGYFAYARRTAAAFRHGWYSTGDVARFDPAGPTIRIVDRSADMILCGGENVYPAEVEFVFSAHPAVAQVSVFRGLDATLGERVLAAVTIRSSAGDVRTHEAALVDFCRQSLAAYKLPRRIFILDELPLNGSGKVLKRALEQRYGAMEDDNSRCSPLIVYTLIWVSPASHSHDGASHREMRIRRNVTGLRLRDRLMHRNGSRAHVARRLQALVPEGPKASRPPAPRVPRQGRALPTRRSGDDAVIRARGPLLCFCRGVLRRIVARWTLRARWHGQVCTGVFTPLAMLAVVSANLHMQDDKRVTLLVATDEPRTLVSSMLSRMHACIGPHALRVGWLTMPLRRCRASVPLLRDADPRVLLMLDALAPASQQVYTKFILGFVYDWAGMPRVPAVPTGRPARRFEGTVTDAVGLVQRTASSYLGKDIELRDPLLSAGLTSAGAVDLREELERRLGVPLPGTLVFDYPTIEHIAGYAEVLRGGNGGTDEVASVERSIHDAISSYLGKDIELRDPLLSAGLTSAGAVDLREELERRLGVPLPGTLVFDYPTIEHIAGYAQTLCCREPTAPTRDAIPPRIQIGQDRLAALTPADISSTRHARATPEDAIVHSHDVHLSGSSRSLLRTLHNESMLLHGGYVRRTDVFDAGAFAMAWSECMYADPQQRLLLVAAATLSDSHRVSKRSAVSIGISSTEFRDILDMYSSPSPGAYYATGVHLSVACGRVAYVFGLGGACASIDTACSSSLVALALFEGADTLLGGGVNLVLTIHWTLACNAARMLSDDSRCKTLDVAANGYVRSEDCIMICSDARMAYGPRVCCKVNQDGRSSSLTAPRGPSQSKLIVACHAKARRDEASDAAPLVHLHMHGTGTALGDPIEVSAFAQAAGQLRTRRAVVSARKSHEGHSEPAAGVASLLRSILKSPVDPVVHLVALNHFLRENFEERSFHAPRQVGVCANEHAFRGTSAFAFQGTNCHGATTDDWVEQSHAVVRFFRAARCSFQVDNNFLCVRVAPHRAVLFIRLCHERLSAGVVSALRVVSQAVQCVFALPTAPLVARVSKSRDLADASSLDVSLSRGCFRLRSAHASCLLAFVQMPSDARAPTRRPTGPRIPYASEDSAIWRARRDEPALVFALLWKDADIAAVDSASCQWCSDTGPPRANGCGKMQWSGARSEVSLYDAQITHAAARLRLRGLSRRRRVQRVARHSRAFRHLYTHQLWRGSRKLGRSSNRGVRARCVRVELTPRKSALPAVALDRGGRSSNAQETGALRVCTSVGGSNAATAISILRSLVVRFDSTDNLLDHIYRIPRQAAIVRVSAARTHLNLEHHVLRVVHAMLALNADAPIMLVLHGTRQDAVHSIGEHVVSAIARSVENESRAAVDHLLHTRPSDNRSGGSLSLRAWARECPSASLTSRPCSRALQLVPLQVAAATQFAHHACVIFGGHGGLGSLLTHLLTSTRIELACLTSRGTSKTGRSVASVAPGVRMVKAQSDVTQRADIDMVSAPFASIPYQSLVHASGTLDDGVSSRQSVRRFWRTLAPKLRGTQRLLFAMAMSRIAHVTAFSSVAAVLFNAAQANHVAASVALDAVVAMQRLGGHSAQSVQWGALSEVGAGSRAASAFMLNGYGAVSVREALALLHFATRSREAARRCVWPVHWNRATFALDRPLHALQCATHIAMPSECTATPCLVNSAWRPPGASGSATRDGIECAVRGVLQTFTAREESTSDDQSIAFDSLMGVEFSRQLEGRVGMALPATFLLDYPTEVRMVDSLLAMIAGDSRQPDSVGVRGNLEVGRVLSILGSPDLDSTHAELGVDSLGAVDIGRQLSQALGTDLPGTLLFDYPTTRSLLSFLHNLGAYDEPCPVDVDAKRPLLAQISASGNVSLVDFSTQHATQGIDALSFSRRARAIDLVDKIQSYRWTDYDPVHAAGVPRGSFLWNAIEVDAEGFSISALETLCMDPQQRALLMHSLAKPTAFDKCVHVSVGISLTEYYSLCRANGLQRSLMSSGALTLSVASGRLSYVHGFEGGATSVDTACSSALVALASSLGFAQGSNSSHVIGGIHLTFVPDLFWLHSQAGMLAADGRCKTLDTSADGFVRSEACAMAFVTHGRLRSSLDAKICARMVNQDGRSSSLTAPNGPSQQRLLREAAQRSGRDFDHIEIHGTGTPLGDPIEVGAVYSYMKVAVRELCKPASITALKSQIGHTEPGSGLLGLVGSCRTNMRAREAALTQLRTVSAFLMRVWPRRGYAPRQASARATFECDTVNGASAFGFSGTNCHVQILSAYAMDQLSLPGQAGVEKTRTYPSPLFQQDAVLFCSPPSRNSSAWISLRSNAPEAHATSACLLDLVARAFDATVGHAAAYTSVVFPRSPHHSAACVTRCDSATGRFICMAQLSVLAFGMRSLVRVGTAVGPKLTAWHGAIPTDDCRSRASARGTACSSTSMGMLPVQAIQALATPGGECASLWRSILLYGRQPHSLTVGNAYAPFVMLSISRAEGCAAHSARHRCDGVKLGSTPPTLSRDRRSERCAIAIAPTRDSTQCVERSCFDEELDLQARLLDAVHKVVGIEISGDETFMDLGIDSIAMLEVSRNFSDAIGLELPQTIAFDYPTVRAMLTFCADIPGAALRNDGLVEEAVEPSMQTPTLDSLFAIERISNCHEARSAAMDCIDEVPGDRTHSVGRMPSPDGGLPMFGKYVRNPFFFDAACFHLQASEASTMDPQQRLVLSECLHLSRDGELLPCDASMLIGSSFLDHLRVLNLGAVGASSAKGFVAAANTLSVLSGRAAYLFNMAGASFVVDTACSSALVAMHLSSKSNALANARHRCVGGVNAILDTTFTRLGVGSALAPDGRCKPLDRSADGYVRSESCVMLTLIREHDHFRCTICASVANQDGRSASLTAPNGAAQQSLLCAALAESTLRVCSSPTFQLHGTGTALGDPIEVGAVVGAVKAGALNLEASKSHLGHAEPVSGLVSLGVVVRGAAHKKRHAILHHGAMNALVVSSARAVEARTFNVSRTEAASAADTRTTCHVSSFGFSGTNAHVAIGLAAEGFKPSLLSIRQMSWRLTLSSLVPDGRFRFTGSLETCAYVSHASDHVEWASVSSMHGLGMVRQIAILHETVHGGSSDSTCNLRDIVVAPKLALRRTDGLAYALRARCGKLRWSTAFAEGHACITLSATCFTHRSRHWSIAFPSPSEAAALHSLIYGTHSPRAFFDASGFVAIPRLCTLDRAMSCTTVQRKRGSTARSGSFLLDVRGRKMNFTRHEPGHCTNLFGNLVMRRASMQSHRAAQPKVADRYRVIWVAWAAIRASKERKPTFVSAHGLKHAKLRARDYALPVKVSASRVCNDMLAACALGTNESHLRVLLVRGSPAQAASAARPHSEVAAMASFNVWESCENEGCGSTASVAFLDAQMCNPESNYSADDRRVHASRSVSCTSRCTRLGAAGVPHLMAWISHVRVLSVLSGGTGALGKLARGWVLAFGLGSVLTTGRHKAKIGRAEWALDALVQADSSRASDWTAARAVANSPTSRTHLMQMSGFAGDASMHRHTCQRTRTTFSAKISFATYWRVHMGSNQLIACTGFGSISSLISPPTQATYAASNTALQCHLLEVSAAGLRSQAILWGAWGQVGMAMLDKAVDALIERSGLGKLAPADALLQLFLACAHVPRCCAGTLVNRFAWAKFIRVYGSMGTRFEHFRARESSDQADAAKGVETPPIANAHAVSPSRVREWVRQSVVQCMGSEVDPNTSLVSAGLDSLGSIAFVALLSDAASLSLPNTLVFDYPTVESIATYIQLQVNPEVQTASGAQEGGSAIDGRDGNWEGGGAPLISRSELSVHPACSRDLIEAMRWLPLEHEFVRRGSRPEVFACELPDANLFDAELFRIPDLEAHAMDVQQRALLRYAFAAVDSNALGRSKVVAVGAQSREWLDLVERYGGISSSHFASGSALSVLCGRVSFVFGFSGESASIDTACSSTLVSLSFAMQCMRRGRHASSACSGGINTILTGIGTVLCLSASMLSPSGRCKALDADADGYVRSEGGGFLHLQGSSAAPSVSPPAPGALACAINHNGSASSLTAPHGPSQLSVLRDTRRVACVPLVCAIELHGTGTRLGDPIESQAVVQVLEEFGSPSPCALSASKTSVGHLEAAAGAVGLEACRARLCHWSISPILHLRHVNPYVALRSGCEGRGAICARTRRELSEGDGGDVRGTSSFGFQGTNAHAMLARAMLPSGITVTFSRHILHETAIAPIATYQPMECLPRSSHRFSVKYGASAPECRAFDDHVIQGRSILPGTGLLECAYVVVQKVACVPSMQLLSVGFHAPFVSNRDAQVSIQLDGHPGFAIMDGNTQGGRTASGRLGMCGLNARRAQALRTGRTLGGGVSEEHALAGLRSCTWRKSPNHIEPVVADNALQAGSAIVFEIDRGSLRPRGGSKIPSALAAYGHSSSMPAASRLHGQPRSCIRRRTNDNVVRAKELIFAARLISLRGSAALFLHDLVVRALPFERNMQVALKPRGKSAQLTYEERYAARDPSSGIPGKRSIRRSLMRSSIGLKREIASSYFAFDTVHAVRRFANALALLQLGLQHAFVIESTCRRNVGAFVAPFAQGLLLSTMAESQRSIATVIRSVDGNQVDMRGGEPIATSSGMRASRHGAWFKPQLHGICTNAASANLAMHTKVAHARKKGVSVHLRVLAWKIDGFNARNAIASFTGIVVRASPGIERILCSERKVGVMLGIPPGGALLQPCCALLAPPQAMSCAEACSVPTCALKRWEPACREVDILRLPNRTCDGVFPPPAYDASAHPLALRLCRFVHITSLPSDPSCKLAAAIARMLPNSFVQACSNLVALARRAALGLAPRLLQHRSACAYLRCMHTVDVLHVALPYDRAAPTSDVGSISGGFGSLGQAVHRWTTSASDLGLSVLYGRRGRKRGVSFSDGQTLSVGVKGDGSRRTIELLALCGATRPTSVAFNASGIVADALLGRQTAQIAARVFASKIPALGCSARSGLHVSFSSISAMFGSPAQASYASANCVLDALCAMQQQLGCEACSIRWGGWAESGMALRNAQTIRRLRENGFGCLTSKEGLEVIFDVILWMRQCEASKIWECEKPSTVVASPFDWAVMKDCASSFCFAALPRVSEQRPDIQIEGKATSSNRMLAGKRLRRSIRAAIAECLGRDDMKDDDLLVDNGLDSLSALELARRLEVKTGVALPGTLLFDYPTIRALVQRLAPTSKESASEVTIDRVLGVLTAASTRISRSHAEPTLDESLLDLGLDSLSALEFARSIEHTLGLELVPTLVFDYPTLRGASEYVVALMGANVQAKRSLAVHEQSSPWRAAGAAASAYVISSNLNLGADARTCVAVPTMLDAIARTPHERWSCSHEFDGLSTYGSHLRDIHRFDPAALRTSPLEASHMDGQQKLLLRAAATTMPRGGGEERRDTGVFVGIGGTEHHVLNLVQDVDPTPYSAVGYALSAASGRLAFALALSGPTLSVDVACASSLVAMHLSFESFGLHTCTAAATLGVNLTLTAGVMRSFRVSGMLAADGRCKTLDAQADGYVRGEGICAVALAVAPPENLTEALVLCGSAVNQNGRSSAITAPHGPSQGTIAPAARRRSKSTRKH